MRSRLPVLLVLVALAACGGSAPSVVRIQNQDIEVLPRTPPPDRVSPLTGEVFDASQDWATRPVLAVKIGNSSPERPQANLDRADVVYEELAEGGFTRLIALYHSRGADRLGPIRSVRRVDPDILAPIGGLFAYSGGVPPIINALRDVPTITDVGADRAPSAYYRDDARDAPYNFYSSTDALWSGRTGTPPQPLFEFLPEGADAADDGEAVGSAAFSFGRAANVSWRYDGGSQTWLRSMGDSPHTIEGGRQLAATNVIVQVVRTTAGDVVDVAGSRTVDSDVLSGGRAIVLRGGRAIEGRWTRSGRDARTEFVDASGDPIELARGRTWIELLPSEKSVNLG